MTWPKNITAAPRGQLLLAHSEPDVDTDKQGCLGQGAGAHCRMQQAGVLGLSVC